MERKLSKRKRKLMPCQIEQFIETLYPKQDPKKLTLENEQRQKKEPTMDPGENLVMFGVVLLCLLFVSGIMVSAR